jgi:hypothetical protein
MIEDIVLGALAILIILVPVTGLTLRFSLRPVVDSIARLLEARAAQNTELLERRVALLEQELGHVRRLAEGRDFDRELERGPDRGR